MPKKYNKEIIKMKKKGLLVVVALLCMASIMAAMAYSSATVTSAATVKISSSNQSLLEIGRSYKREYENDITLLDKGALGFDFTQGTGKFGFQPNSEYVYENLFRIVNRQQKGADIIVTVDTDLPYAVIKTTDGQVLYDASEGVNNHSITLAGGGSNNGRNITVVFNIPKEATVDAWNIINSYPIVFHSETIVK
jgi:hypothetical protein